MIRERLRREIDELRLDERDREAFIVLMASTVLLLLFSYWGRPSFYVRSELIGWVGEVRSGAFYAGICQTRHYLPSFEGFHLADVTRVAWYDPDQPPYDVTQLRDYPVWVRLPFWPLFLLFALPTFILFWRDRCWPAAGCCMACGHDLDGGNSGLCPACSAQVRYRPQAWIC